MFVFVHVERSSGFAAGGYAPLEKYHIFHYILSNTHIIKSKEMAVRIFSVANPHFTSAPQ
jgi:hypothetical protein